MRSEMELFKIRRERERVKEERELVISKLERSSLDWFRFWNQYENKKVNAEINPVRLLIYSLPLTSEGYSRAKSILNAKYKTSTVITASRI